MLFTYRGETWAVPLPADGAPATVNWAASAARAQYPSRWAPNTLSFVAKGKRLKEDADASVDLLALGVRGDGGRVAVLGVTAEEAAQPPPAPAHLRDDLGPSRPAPRPPPLLLPTSGGGRDGTPRYGFGEVRPLEHLPHRDRARAILQQLGSHAGVLAVMKARGWYVPLLTELPPGASVTRGASDAPAHLLGLNSGGAIHLLLRTPDGEGFRRVAADAAGFDGQWLLDVLYHELAHIEVAGDNPHSREFYALEKAIKREAEAAHPFKRGAGVMLGGGAAGGARFTGWADGGGEEAEPEPPQGGVLGGAFDARAAGLSAAAAAARAAEARAAAARAAAEAKARAEEGGGAGGGGGGGAPPE